MSNQYFLSHGSHETREAGMCAMEWVAYLAGEQHSDGPVCVSPLLRRYCIALNDRLDDEQRQKLRPYLARTIGTAADGLDEQRLAMCREFLLHRSLPRYLDAAGRQEAADRLLSLPDTLTAEETLQELRWARDVAREARETAKARLTGKIRAELAKRGFAAAAAATAAAADAAAAAAAAAAAVAAADAAAAAVADVAADAAAVAVAVAVAVAAADAAAAPRYSAVWNAVYYRLRKQMAERAREIVKPINDELTPAAFELLDRMLPTEVVRVPVVSEWREICQVA